MTIEQQIDITRRDIEIHRLFLRNTDDSAEFYSYKKHIAEANEKLRTLLQKQKCRNIVLRHQKG